MEIELKLLVDPADADRLLRSAALRTTDKQQKKHLENIYFDTPDGQLQAGLIGLRLRRDGDNWLQTLKGGGGTVGGLHSRQEIEYPVAGPTLDFGGLAGTPWAKYFKPTLAASLKPVFHTDFHRVIRLVRLDDAEIEVALDRGEIRAGEASEPICEIELELKSGSVTALFELARQLLEIAPLRLENASKAIVAECEAEAGFRCTVSSFFGGVQYRLFKQMEIRDVRLVYAPPGSIGNYGGEVDNWMWPRHTGDFTLIRAYVGKDGKPAPFAKDNIPYRNKHWLRVAADPLREGDFVMVAGYPGRTNRYALARSAVHAAE